MPDVSPTVQLQEARQRAEAWDHPEVPFLPELLEMDQPAGCGRGLFTETELNSLSLWTWGNDSARVSSSKHGRCYRLSLSSFATICASRSRFCFTTSTTCEMILFSFKTHHNLLRPIRSELTQPMFRHKLVTHRSLTAILGVFSNNPVWGSGRGLQNCYKRIKEKN